MSFDEFFMIFWRMNDAGWTPKMKMISIEKVNIFYKQTQLVFAEMEIVSIADIYVLRRVDDSSEFFLAGSEETVLPLTPIIASEPPILSNLPSKYKNWAGSAKNSKIHN